MIINYDVSGSERKRLVAAIAEYCGEKAKYLGAPSFAYQVGGYTVSSSGEVTIEDNSTAAALIRALREKNFEAEDPLEAIESNSTNTDCSRQGFNLPANELGEDAIRNLNSIIEAKGKLICKALDVPELPIEHFGEHIGFPWFTRELTEDENAAYSHFISALCEMAKNQKRITAKEKDVDNEKYAFRCFLLRLGFIGSEFKAERKVLLRNLTGSSAFKSGAKAKEEEVCE